MIESSAAGKDKWTEEEKLAWNKAEGSMHVVRDRIESLLKNVDPDAYVTAAARRLAEAFGDRNLWAQWRPHHLLHSMELCCAVHRRDRNKPTTEAVLRRVMNAYIDFEEPYGRIQLKGEKWPQLFFLALGRQQFTAQEDYGKGKRNLGRCVELFCCEQSFGECGKRFRSEFGLDLEGWIFFCWAVNLVALEQQLAVHFTLSSLKELEKWFKPETVQRCLDTLCCTVEEVAKSYQQLRTGCSVLYDPFLSCTFSRTPILKISNDSYVLVHRPFVARRSWEGLADICEARWPKHFAKEIGKSMDRYVGRLLADLPHLGTVLTEGDLQNHLDGEVCDYAVLASDAIILVECKGVRRETELPSQNALANDNATGKIAKGLRQLTSTAAQIRSGRLPKDIAPDPSMPMLAFVVTLGTYLFVNSQWYREQILIPRLLQKSPQAARELEVFRSMPQIVDLPTLESLLVCSREAERSVMTIVDEKLSQSDLRVGDWNVYLASRYGHHAAAEVRFLAKAVDDFLHRWVVDS